MIVVVVLTAASWSLADDKTYYVSTAGNDANTGLSPSQAWRTIQRAVNQPVGPGDVVHVANGTYVGWATSLKGTSAKPIRWIADGDAVIVDQPYPGGPGNTSDNIRLMYADYNVIDGFRSVNAPRAGIAVRGDSVNPIVGAVVRNCVMDANHTWGLFDAFADDCLYEHNTAANSCAEHGIYHSNSGDRTIIRYNAINGNARAGIHVNGDASQGGDGICSDLEIVGNVIYGNGGGSSCGAGGAGGINLDGAQSSLIADNLLYDNHASGIIGYRIDAADAAKDDVIVNNTVIMAANGRWALKLVDGSTGCTVFDNVLYQATAPRGAIAIDAASLAGFRSDRNVVVNRFSTNGDATTITLAQWRSQTGQDLSSPTVDPTTLATFFADPAGNDWHLKAGSPAINAGIASLDGHAAPAFDFEGDLRPVGAAYDIGCDERNTAPPIAQFSGSPLSGAVPLTVTFTDASVGGISTRAWTFGDGGTSSSTNPTHLYATAGAYDVGLTVTGPSGSDAETKLAYIDAFVDSDGDAVRDSQDCAPANPALWAIPSPARNLLLQGHVSTSLTWSAPAQPGGTGGPTYDLLRSASAAGFASAVCVATNVTAMSASDATAPAPVFFYLVRAENACGGTLGVASSGAPRSGRTCP